MPVYRVSYDLVKHKDYPKLWAELERLKAQKVLLSEWVMDLKETDVQGIYDHFLQFIDADDRLVVSKITTKETRARGLKGTRDWLASH